MNEVYGLSEIILIQILYNYISIFQYWISEKEKQPGFPNEFFCIGSKENIDKFWCKLIVKTV